MSCQHPPDCIEDVAYRIEWCQWCGALNDRHGWKAPTPPKRRKGPSTFEIIAVDLPLAVVGLSLLWAACIKITVWCWR